MRYVIFRTAIDRDSYTHEPLRIHGAPDIEADHPGHAFQIAMDALVYAPGHYEVYPVEGSQAFMVRPEVRATYKDGEKIL